MNTKDPERNSFSYKFWTGGVNSLLNPADISEKQYAWAENILNRGGIVQTRPGFKLCASLPGGRLQGFCIFTPNNSTGRLLVAIDGLIYVGLWPFFHFTPVHGLKFSPDAPFIQFCECLKSVTRNADGSLTLIEPIRLVVIGDGESRTATWDGNSAQVMNADAPHFQTPAGLWMTYNTSRLWISNGTHVRVSDLGDPTSFLDDQFLATRSFFQMPDIITGMIETSNKQGLLVFTSRTTTLFQSYILDKRTWGQTVGFANLLLPGIGCDAGRTAVNQYGVTYWHSLIGIVSLNAATSALQTSKMMALDEQMMRSKRNLSPEMAGACAVAHENILLVSVPSGGKYNEHTWVLDQAPLSNLSVDNPYSPPASAWASIWTGVRPVQWADGKVGGRVRLFFASYDRTPANGTHIHIWEAMRDDRTDADGRIACQFQLGVSESDRLKVFKYAEFEVSEVLGDVNLVVYLGGTRGPWMIVGEFRLHAEPGSIGSGQQTSLDTASTLQAFKPQSRTLRTEEFTSQGQPDSPEFFPNTPGRDKGFSLLFEWRGQMAIKGVRMVLDDASESNRGKPSTSGEVSTNVVLEDGSVPPPTT